MDSKFPPHLLGVATLIQSWKIVNFNAGCLVVLGIMPSTQAASAALAAMENCGLVEEVPPQHNKGPMYRLTGVDQALDIAEASASEQEENNPTTPSSGPQEESMYHGRTSVQLNLSPEDRQQLAILLVHLEGELGNAIYTSPGFQGSKLVHEKFGFSVERASWVMEKLMPTYLKQDPAMSGFCWFNEILREFVTPEAKDAYLKKKHPRDKNRLSLARAFLRRYYLKTNGSRSLSVADPQVIEIAQGCAGFRGRDEATLREELMAFQLYDSSLVTQPDGKFGIGRVEPEWDTALRSQQAPTSVPAPASSTQAPTVPKAQPLPPKRPEPQGWKQTLGSVQPVPSRSAPTPSPAPVTAPAELPPRTAPSVVQTTSPPRQVALPPLPPATPPREEEKPSALPTPKFEERLTALEKKCEALAERCQSDAKALREEIVARDKEIAEAQARITALEEEVVRLKTAQPASPSAIDTPQHEEADELHLKPSAAEPEEAPAAEILDDKANTDSMADTQTMTGPAESASVEDDGNSSVVIDEASDKQPEVRTEQRVREAWYQFLKEHPRFTYWTPPTVLYLFTQGEPFDTLEVTDVWERHFGERRKVTQMVGNWDRNKVHTERHGKDKRLGRRVKYISACFSVERRLLEKLRIEFTTQRAAA